MDYNDEDFWYCSKHKMMCDEVKEEALICSEGILVEGCDLQCSTCKYKEEQ